MNVNTDENFMIEQFVYKSFALILILKGGYPVFSSNTYSNVVCECQQEKRKSILEQIIISWHDLNVLGKSQSDEEFHY